MECLRVGQYPAKHLLIPKRPVDAQWSEETAEAQRWPSWPR